MSRRLQQRYRLFVNGVDVTADISGDIVYESSPDVVASLSFTLSGNRFLSRQTNLAASLTSKDMIKMFDKVEFEGGTLENDLNYGPIFKGFVKYIRPQFPDSGSMSVNVEAVDYSFRAAANRGYFVYPSTASPRQWAIAKSLKTSDIVRGISSDMGVPIFKNLDGSEDVRLALDKVFTLTAPLTQKNESDWQVLRKLAKQLNCSVWTSYESGNTYLHFVDKSFLRDDSNYGEIVFAYPLRAGHDFVISEFKPEYRILQGVNVEQDFSAMSETKKVVTTFDYAKGEEITVFEAKITENGRQVTKYFTFEIDEAKTRALSPEQRKDLEKIAYSIAGDEESGHSIEEIAPYFKPATFLDERRNFVVDKPYFGITITATVDGDINITPRRNYRVLGIGRYGSDSLDQNYYLRTLRHRWGSSGFLTELEFIR